MAATAIDLYTSSRRTCYTVSKGKKNENGRFYFHPVGARTGDVAKEMGNCEIEIQRKLVFDSYMMVRAGILAVLEVKDQTNYQMVNTNDDRLFFSAVVNNTTILQHFYNNET
jgi:hypothetical protein